MICPIMAHIEPRTRKDGSTAYRARVSIPTATGYSTLKQTFDSHSEAVAWAAKAESGKLEGASAGAATVGKMLEAYYEGHAGQTRSAKWNLLRVKQVQADPLGKVRVDLLVPQDIIGWRDRRLKAVSPSTVAREWNLLSGAFTWAIEALRWKIEHPMRGSWIAKQKPKGGPPRDRLPEPDEITRLKHAASHPSATATSLTIEMFLFGCYTGMRSGEMLGLRWEDVNLTGKTAKVTGQADGGRKTAAAVRTVALSDSAISVLKRVAAAFNRKDVVFPITAENRDALWRKLCKMAEVEDLHFHDSRHYAATTMAQKLDAFALARQLGIADLRVIRDTYYNRSASDVASDLNK